MKVANQLTKHNSLIICGVEPKSNWSNYKLCHWNL